MLANTEGLIRAAQFTVERDVPSDLPAVSGDLMAASQCLENLITNALKYAKDGRWIGIRAQALDDPKGGKEVRISVSDRGMGISARDLPYIFEPFYRSEQQRRRGRPGVGLGLAVARRIAESLGGSLEVRSEPGQGSRFLLRVPASAATPADVRFEHV